MCAWVKTVDDESATKQKLDSRYKTMKKLVALLPLAAIFVPTLTFAAYNDVTLTTNAVISVGGYTLNVSGSSAAIQSITVDAGSFSVTLASGSSFSVSSPTLQQLSSDVTSDVTNNTCTGSASSISLAYSGAGTVTNVVTPSATICTTVASSGGSSNSGGSGSGPAGIFTLAPPTPYNPALKSSSNTGGLTETQIQSILLLLSAFDADQATINNINAVLHGQATQPSAPTLGVFTRDLELNDTGEDILRLQQFLNTHGFPVAPAGPGSPGDETNYFGLNTYRALIKFQNSDNLPTTGFFGPLTRAALASTSITTVAR